MAECARLIALEFGKVAESQSVLITLWEQIQSQKSLNVHLLKRLEALEGVTQQHE